MSVVFFKSCRLIRLSEHDITLTVHILGVVSLRIIVDITSTRHHRRDCSLLHFFVSWQYRWALKFIHSQWKSYRKILNFFKVLYNLSYFYGKYKSSNLRIAKKTNLKDWIRQLRSQNFPLNRQKSQWQLSDWQRTRYCKQLIKMYQK